MPVDMAGTSGSSGKQAIASSRPSRWYAAAALIARAGPEVETEHVGSVRRRRQALAPQPRLDVDKHAHAHVRRALIQPQRPERGLYCVVRGAQVVAARGAVTRCPFLVQDIVDGRDRLAEDVQLLGVRRSVGRQYERWPLWPLWPLWSQASWSGVRLSNALSSRSNRTSS